MKCNFYMRGDMNNGEAVIQALEKLGGINVQNFSGDDPCGLYFFNSPSKAILYLDDYNAPQILRERRQIYPDFQLCVYFTGDSNNSEKIIAELERLGGTNTFGIQAKNPFRLYFIDKNNMILSAEQSMASNLYKALVRYGVELTLPEVKTITIRDHIYEESAVLERISSLKPIK